MIKKIKVKRILLFPFLKLDFLSQKNKKIFFLSFIAQKRLSWCNSSLPRPTIMVCSHQPPQIIKFQVIINSSNHQNKRLKLIDDQLKNLISRRVAAHQVFKPRPNLMIDDQVKNFNSVAGISSHQVFKPRPKLMIDDPTKLKLMGIFTFSPGRFYPKKTRKIFFPFYHTKMFIMV